MQFSGEESQADDDKHSILDEGFEAEQADACVRALASAEGLAARPSSNACCAASFDSGLSGCCSARP